MRTRDEYRGLLEKYSFRNLTNDEAVTAGLSYQLAQVELLLDIRELLQNQNAQMRVVALEAIADVMKRATPPARRVRRRLLRNR
jgi:hypothetical protein